jgi:hypothetical protein
MRYSPRADPIEAVAVAHRAAVCLHCRKPVRAGTLAAHLAQHKPIQAHRPRRARPALRRAVVRAGRGAVLARRVRSF